MPRDLITHLLAQASPHSREAVQNLTNSDWFEAIVAIAAIWGAGLATWEAVARRRERHPDVRVDSHISTLPGIPDGLPRLVLTARNRSDRYVQLVGAGLFFPNRFFALTPWKGPQRSWNVVPWQIRSPDPRLAFPHELEPGRAATDMLNLPQIASDLAARGDRGQVRIRGFFTDETGYLYVSRPHVIDVDQWGPPGGLPVVPLPDRIVGVIRQLENDTPVFAADGEPLGVAHQAGDRFFLLDRGEDHPPLLIPGQWVENYDGEALHLSVNVAALGIANPARERSPADNAADGV
jgi:hypothetical protein